MRKNNLTKVFILCAFLIFIAGCATWIKVGGPYSNSAALYKVDLPWGWMKYRGKDLMITRDGIFLENIIIKRVNINKKLEHTKKKFVKGMLPEEIAEIKIDDIVTDPDIHNFELIENIPVTISGQNGLRLVFLFRNKDGLKYKHIQYGFGYEDWVYSLIYTATSDYYFYKNLEEFNEVIKSFKFIPSAAGETTPLIIPISNISISKKTDEKESPSNMTSQSPVSTYSEYYRLLYQTITKAVFKPQSSGNGVINAAFTLLSDGTLEEVNILEGSSGEPGLRNAVEKAIRDSAPFPPFSEDIKAEGKKTFTISIEFRN